MKYNTNSGEKLSCLVDIRVKGSVGKDTRHAAVTKNVV